MSRTSKPRRVSSEPIPTEVKLTIDGEKIVFTVSDLTTSEQKELFDRLFHSNELDRAMVARNYLESVYRRRHGRPA